MKTLRTLSIILFMASSAILLSACTVVKVHEDGYEHNGPPPHAPAHGYRHKHKKHDLEYNSDLGIYVVTGLAEHYFIDGIFYKRTKHGWYSSHDIDKAWKEHRGTHAAHDGHEADRTSSAGDDDHLDAHDHSRHDHDGHGG